MLHKHKPSQKQLVTGYVHEATSAPDGTLIVKANAHIKMPVLFYQQKFVIIDRWFLKIPDYYTPEKLWQHRKNVATTIPQVVKITFDPN